MIPKNFSGKKRRTDDIIMEQAVATGLGTIGPDRIDEINILQATYEQCGRRLHSYLRSRICCLMMQ